jgi:uncharacterized membrane protein SpoIIM required for sporulation
MFEMLISPRKAKKEPWQMFFVGLVYASLALLLTNWIFSPDAVNAKYMGWIVVIFTLMFSLPFMYYLMRDEEGIDLKEEGTINLLKEHSRALYALLFFFLGLTVAFSFWYVMLSSTQSFKAQIETYCSINRPGNAYNDCVTQFSAQGKPKLTANLTAKDKLFLIFANNIYVLIFTLVFSLIFGAGAIFVLTWNATVIAAAIGIFTKSNLSNLPLGLARYMIHGIPEIAAYFIAFLAGGILSFAVTKHDIRGEKFWGILQDSLNLVILAVVVLFVAAIIEVFITPALF